MLWTAIRLLKIESVHFPDGDWTYGVTHTTSVPQKMASQCRVTSSWLCMLICRTFQLAEFASIQSIMTVSIPAIAPSIHSSTLVPQKWLQYSVILLTGQETDFKYAVAGNLTIYFIIYHHPKCIAGKVSTDKTKPDETLQWNQNAGELR